MTHEIIGNNEVLNAYAVYNAHERLIVEELGKRVRKMDRCAEIFPTKIKQSDSKPTAFVIPNPCNMSHGCT